MLAQDQTPGPPPPPPQPLPAPTTPPSLARGWLRGLIAAIRQGGLQPKDPRVKALWNLLRRRQSLVRHPWARTRLRFIWQKGLDARPRPKTATRLLAVIRDRAVSRIPLPASRLPHSASRFPPAASRFPTLRRPRAALRRVAMQRLRPLAVRRVGTIRSMARPVAPLMARAPVRMPMRMPMGVPRRRR